MKRRWSTVGLFLLACGGTKTETREAPRRGADAGAECPAGTELCPCYGNGTCNDGLVCGSDLCVRLAGAADAGTGGASGAGGAPPAAGGAPPGGGGAPECRQQGAPCAALAPCCSGSTCVADPLLPGRGTCERVCLTSGDCPSRCCTPLADADVPTSVCAPLLYCAPCRSEGLSCLDDPGSCCAGTACAYDDDSGLSASCAAVCEADAQCTTGCCAPVAEGSATWVCSDPLFCGW
jgi:hypothetical protein